MSERACASVRTCITVHIPTASAPTFIPRNSESSFQEQDVKIPTPNTCDKDRHVAGKDNYRDGTGTARPPPAARTPTTPPPPPFLFLMPALRFEGIVYITFLSLFYSFRERGERRTKANTERERKRETEGRQNKIKQLNRNKTETKAELQPRTKFLKRRKRKRETAGIRLKTKNKTIKQ